MKMFYKKDNCEVEVYKFFEDRTCLIYSLSKAGKSEGNGWEKVAVKNLIPLDAYKELFETGSFMSKTEKNKIKSRLTLTQAIWTCTDNNSFTDVNDAIAHERTLINEVEPNNDECNM